MSLRQKYIVVVHAAIVAMATGFLIGRGAERANVLFACATVLLLSTTLVVAYRMTQPSNQENRTK